MSWEKSSYTAAGAALLSESLSGGALVITRAVSGTGTADADLSGETGVSGETHDLKLLDIETVESGGETARRVKIQITGADETYIMHQVGVYGRLNDDAETLLFIMQDARGVEVPSTKVNGDFEIELSALLAVSNKANISITVDPQMQALAKMVGHGLGVGFWGGCKRRTGQGSYSGAGQLWRGCYYQGHHDPRRRLGLAAGI